MIKQSFGHLKFSELTAWEAEIRFNALDGSNTRPSALIREGDEDLKKFAGENFYFGSLSSLESIPSELEGILSE